MFLHPFSIINLIESKKKDKKSLHLKVTLTEEHDSIPLCIMSVSGILSLGCVFSDF